MSDDPATRLRENATGIASLLVTGSWLALMFSGVGDTLWLAVLLFGYVVVVPLVAILFGDEEDVTEWWDADEFERIKHGRETETTRQADQSARDALETLRDRYAAGDLTDEQFEAKLERLLETETLEDAANGQDTARDDRDGDRTVEFDRERDGV